MRKLKTYLTTGVAVCGLTLTTSTQAVPSVSNFVETENNISFDFSGDDAADLIFGIVSANPILFPTLNHWSFFNIGHFSADQSGYGVSFIVSHLPDGPSLGAFSGKTVFGSAASGSDAEPHSSATDSFTFTITVNQNPNAEGGYGTFSGSFSAVHREPSVPDAASTAALASVAFGLLGFARRFLGGGQLG
jgi:hypothetical protein